MRPVKRAVIVSAAVLIIAPPFAGDSAVSESMPKTAIPLLNDFDEKFVNGEVSVELPEGVDAHAVITFSSPEGAAVPYYDNEIKGGDTYLFPIEGYNNTVDDFRVYTLKMDFKSAEYGGSARLSKEFTIPDPFEFSDSGFYISFVFAADEKCSSRSAELKENTVYMNDDGGGSEKSIYQLHLGEFMKGDVDGNKKVISTDAAMVLRYSTLLSSGKNDMIFDERQLAAADVDCNGIIDTKDAAGILRYSTLLSSYGSEKVSWDMAVMAEQ